MQAVLDTNIIVSGILSPTGAARALLDMARSGSITMVSSSILLDELEEVLLRFFPRAAASEIRAAVEEIADIVEPASIPAVTRDPDDDHVLAAALAGEAVCFVTRDQDLLTLDSYQGIAIVEPGPALRTIRSQLE